MEVYLFLAKIVAPLLNDAQRPGMSSSEFRRAQLNDQILLQVIQMMENKIIH